MNREIRGDPQASLVFRCQSAGLVCLSGSQRKVERVIENDLLPVTTQNETQKFFKGGVKRLTRRFVRVEKSDAAEWIAGTRNVLICRRVKWTVRMIAER